MEEGELQTWGGGRHPEIKGILSNSVLIRGEWMGILTCSDTMLRVTMLGLKKKEVKVEVL